ncbi:MAG: DUF92 domain-containing protein [Flavobacteriales bacterium]
MIAFAMWSYKRGSVAISGAFAMVIITSVLAILNAWLVISAMGTMFLTSSLLSKWRKDQKQKTTKHIIMHEPRNATQAFANLGVAFVLAFLSGVLNCTDMLFYALGAIAAANADTWASEIGVLSRSKPKYLLSRQVVDAGLSGGVTALGIFASIAGSACIAAIYFLFSHNLTLTLIIWMAGFIGSIMDSLLGELIQVKYKTQSGLVTEIQQQGATFKGMPYVNNDTVNFICSLTGALMGFLGHLFF